ncbi:hypothetical protein, partial [Pseudomonas aeruginosa]|uniref:hypothetical protein n=3 Tax=Gammaproteobacteria TaxID=1236 RepID=UPI0039692049
QQDSEKQNITEWQKGQDVFLEYRHHDAGTKNDPSGLRPDTLPTPHAARLKSVSVRRSRNRQTLNRGVPLACQWVPI